MDKMVIRDAHEPWLRGSPELDIIFRGYMQGGYRTTGFFPDGRPIIDYDPAMLTQQYAGCAGERAADWRTFNFGINGTNTPAYGTALLAETREFSGIESVYDPAIPFVVHERRIPLVPPFEFEVLERDDGYQCPDPP